MTSIVTVNVSQTIAPTPNALQKTGAFISQGGTNTSPGTATLLTQLSDLDGIIKEPAELASASYHSTTGFTTFTSAQVHGLPIGDVVDITIADVTSPTTPGLFNGTFPCTITTTTAFTTTAITGTTQDATASTGTWASQSSLELPAMANTFFSQGAQQGVYVLELGPGNPDQGVSFLNDWIANNDTPIYSYLVPRNWDGLPAFIDLLGDFASATAKTYFFTTTTLATYGLYAATLKSCFAMIEAPEYGIWPANALTDLTWAAGWPANVLTALTWAATNGGQVTAVTTTAHGVLPGQTFVLSGSTPAAYNGTFVALPGTTADQLIYALADDPGADTVLGTLVAATAGTATATTTTAHGVLPGQTFTISGSVGATIPAGYNGTFTALPGTTGSTLIYALAANPGTSTVDGTLVASLYSSEGIPSTEFSAAAPFWVTLNYNPSTTNRVTPTAFAFLIDVTPFPRAGNASILQRLQNAYVNVVGTGAEGGISNTALFWGTTMDGRDFTYWYSVDWVQVQVNQALANAVINGSNNPINPLYYNQDGINRLQQVVARVMNNGLSFGLVLGAIAQTQLDGTSFGTAVDAGDFVNQTVVNAVPFVEYSTANPSHYRIGQYDGLSVVYTPTRGFKALVFNVNVTDFVTT